VDLQTGVASQEIEVRVIVENRRVRSKSDRSDEAVDDTPHRFPTAPTLAVQQSSAGIARRATVFEMRAGEEPAQLVEVDLIAGAGQHFHDPALP
jgi:hypothetical protein